MYSYNRIHSDRDNVVRVELNSSYRPRVTRTAPRESVRIASSVNRNDTFTKGDRPSNIIRSDTFILKHHDESSDERNDYNTYNTRTKKKAEKKFDDKSNYSTYTRPEKKATIIEKPLYINTDTYRKQDKKRSSVSQESENLSSGTFTKSSKPKRVESLIKRFDMSFWRRRGSKEKSPSPSGSDTIKRSKNIFNLMTSGKKSTRDIGIDCKMDEDHDYNQRDMGTRKSSMLSLISEKKYRPMKSAQRYENGSNQQLTSIIKSPERRYPYHESIKKSTTPMPPPIRVEIGVRNVNKYANDSEPKKRPIGIASPLPQARNRSVLKNVTVKSYDNKKVELNRSYAPPKVQEPSSNFSREGSDRMSFKDYREKLKLKKDNRRITDNSDDELRQSYQQSFFIPM